MPTSPPASDPPRLIVTRPQPQASDWVRQLQAQGQPAVALPLLGIGPPADAAPVQRAWQAIAAGAVADSGPALAAAAAGPSVRPLAMVMFVSPSAVQRFFAERPASLPWPAGVVAAAPGLGTRLALRQAGVPVVALCSPPIDGEQFDSEALWAVLAPRCAWAGQAALVVRGEGGRDWLAEVLRQHGAQVHFVEAYRRTVPVPDAAGQALLVQALGRPAAHAWLFSSSEALGHLPALAPGADWSASLALATHPRIAEAARRLGLGRVLTVAPSPEAVAAALRRADPRQA